MKINKGVPIKLHVAVAACSWWLPYPGALISHRLSGFCPSWSKAWDHLYVISLKRAAQWFTGVCYKSENNSLASGIFSGGFLLHLIKKKKHILSIKNGCGGSAFITPLFFSPLIGIWPWILNKSPTGSEIHLDKVDMWHDTVEITACTFIHLGVSAYTKFLSGLIFLQWTRLPASPQSPSSHHITSVLKQLQRPPVYFSIVLKILLLTSKSLQSLSPPNSQIGSSIPTHPLVLSGPPLPPSFWLLQSFSQTL